MVEITSAVASHNCVTLNNILNNMQICNESQPGLYARRVRAGVKVTGTRRRTGAVASLLIQKVMLQGLHVGEFRFHCVQHAPQRTRFRVLSMPIICDAVAHVHLPKHIPAKKDTFWI